MRTPRRALAALTTSVLCVGLVACSGSADSEDKADPAPSTDSAGEPSQEPTDDASESPAAEVSTAPGAGDEVAPFLTRLKNGFGEEGSVHVELAMSGGAAVQAEGDTSYGPDGSDMRLTMELGQGTGEVSMLMVDDEVFLSMPGVTPEGKYFEVPADSPALAGVESAGLSPADSFASFEAGLLKVVEKGTEELDGEATERFELHLDAERAMAAMGSAAGPAAGLPETLVYDLWLDEEDRMRRIEYAVAGTEVTMDMTDWGDVEPVTAPDASDLVEAPEMGGAGAQ